MKHLKKIRIATTCVALLFSNSNLFAQWSGTNPITTSSNVNIQSPGNDAVLDVGGQGDSATLQITVPNFLQGSYIAPFRMRATHGPFFGPYTYSPLFCIRQNGFVGLKTETPNEMLTLNGGNALALNGNFTARNGSFMTQNSSGTTNFRVDENGLLIARQIDVHLDPIPDYVFHAAFDIDSADFYSKTGKYKKLSLYEIDDFVKKHHHLPGIKSASQYNAIGTVNLGELNVKLLEKVEELTLHSISQQREIDNLKERLEKIESNSATFNQSPFKSHATNGVLIATFAIFAFVLVKDKFYKLIKTLKL